MQAMTAADYRKLPTHELRKRYRFLEADTSCQTTEEELGRMFALQEIGEVLIERVEAI